MFNHVTVLQKETVLAVLPSPEQLLQRQDKAVIAVDCTLGGGGHALQFFEECLSRPDLSAHAVTLFGVDRDQNAHAAAAERLAYILKESPHFSFVPLKMNFSEVGSYLIDKLGKYKIDALYADLGVSSPQLDHAQRGFSFAKEGPIDMRMDEFSGLTAKHILETYDETELAKIFFEYGEEPKGRRLAQQIVGDRAKGLLPLQNTVVFADYIAKKLNYHQSRVHPATRIFQALRIEVNDELKSVEDLLARVPDLMSDFARVGVISFHSLEDRIIKNGYRFWESETKDEITGAFPLNPKGGEKRKWGSEKPRGGLTASAEESKENPRARSARLRAFHFLESSLRL